MDCIHLDYLSMGYMDLGCIGFEVYIGLVLCIWAESVVVIYGYVCMCWWAVVIIFFLVSPAALNKKSPTTDILVMRLKKEYVCLIISINLFRY